MIKRFFAVALLFLISCNLGLPEFPPHNARTPDGYRVWLPKDLSQDPNLLLVWIDIRVNDWLALRGPQYGPENVSNLAITTTFLVIDDYHFNNPWSPTGYAVGDIQTDVNHPFLRCSIYDQAKGQLPSDGIGFAVISYELDHRLDLNPEH